MDKWLEQLNRLVWGPVLPVLILGTGIYFMVRMRFLPVRNLKYALRCSLGRETGKKGQGEISPFSSLMTELAATIGTGNIVGVATAMVLGGAGALFWMNVAAVAGMATKFAESMLSVKYRVRLSDGSLAGGPMYTLKRAFPFPMPGKLLAYFYAVAAVCASFGMGNMTQANSIALSFQKTFGIERAKTGLVLTILVILVILGGIRGISKVAVYMVPGMALFYVLGCLCVIGANIHRLLPCILEICILAFSKKAVAGGTCGAAVAAMWQAFRYGISRGVFSNEAGLGAGGISAAAARTDDCVRQGYISMTGVFFDTIVICTLTGLTISTSGVLGMKTSEGNPITGAELVIGAFSTVFGNLGGLVVSMGIALFAFATIIAWEYQGEKAFGFIQEGKPEKKKKRYCMMYRLFYGLITLPGAVCALEAVWNFSDIMNALMAVPNLICLLILSGQICRDMISGYGRL